MDIILHIGIEKTGTSTIQSILKLNQEWLAANKVLVPKSLRPHGRGDSHAILPALFCRDHHAVQLRKYAGQPDDITFENFFQKVSTEFENEIIQAKKCGFNCMLISSEHLSSRLHTIEEITLLANWLKQYGLVKKIIVYLRRQDNFVMSTYSTELKSGSVRTFSLPGPNWAKERYDYQYILMLWSTVFGKECLIVRPFEAKQWIKQNLIEDFIYFVGLTHGVPMFSEDKNKSLDPKSLAILLHYNQWVNKTGFEYAEECRARLVKSLESLSTHSRICLSGKEATEFVGRFAAGNNWVAKNFLKNADILFFETINLEQQSCMLPHIDIFDFYPILWEALMKKKKIQNKTSTIIKEESLFEKISKLLHLTHSH